VNFLLEDILFLWTKCF